MGIIRPTVPHPDIFFGNVREVSEYAGVSRRTACNMIDTDGYTTRKGFRRMTPEEENKYYQPPQPRNQKVKHKQHESKRFWHITFFRNWEKGDPSPKDPVDHFSGTITEFNNFTGCKPSQLVRMLNTHFKVKDKYPLATFHGWRVARVRKYIKPAPHSLKLKRIRHKGYLEDASL